MKRQTKVLAVLFMMFVVLVGQSSAQEMGRYIVHTTGDFAVNEAARQGVVARAGLTLKVLPTRTGLVVLIPDVAIGPIAGIPGVVAVEPDVVLTAVAEVLPWGVDRIDADLAWGTATGAGVAIAIIDTGIDKDHLDLAVDGGINFVATGKGPPWARKVDPDAWDDDNGHGTHCAGIAAALDNDIGVVGVAPAALIYGVKVLDSSGSGYLSDIMDGIYWAADNGADVINLSLGIDKETLDQYPSDKQALQDAVDYASGSCVVVAAAGNEGNGGDTVIYPARFDSAIAVSATDSGDNLAGFSSTGPSVELAAPGVSIYSTYKDGGYATGSGTSMSAPHVAGTAALVIAAGESVSQLQTTAEDLGSVGWDPYYGHGLVDAASAAGVSEGPVNDPPAVTITSPADGSTFDSGANISFVGTASDNEDGDLTASLVWTSSIDEQIGTGGSFSTILSDGNHTITAEVTDSDGANGSASVSITVEAPTENEPPIVSITSPADGSTFGSGVSISFAGTAIDTEDGNLTGSLVWTSSIDDQIGTGGSFSAVLSDGTHTITASVTDNDGLTDIDEVIITVTEAGDEIFMYVESIVIDLLDRNAGRNTFTKALATVTIVDGVGSLVEGATVYGHWSGATSDSDSGVTDSSGEVTLESNAVKNASSGTTFTFTVDDVVKSGWTYVP